MLLVGLVQVSVRIQVLSVNPISPYGSNLLAAASCDMSEYIL